MKSETLKQALDAHGWVGLVLSLPLFIIFWAGSITLFLPEVELWSKLPYYPVTEKVVETDNADLDYDLNGIIDAQFSRYPIDNRDVVNIILPSAESPYMWFGMQLPIGSGQSDVAESQADAAEENTKTPEIEKESKYLLINPFSGQVFTEHNPFGLGYFINALHYTLHIPQGLYVVGVISFLFFVVMITGVLVQLRKLVKNFFKYRQDQSRRSQMNDMHNVVGVISLPYMILFALSGVVLNLSIVFLIPTSLTIYGGDRDALFKDAGFVQYKPEERKNNAVGMPDLRALISQTEQKFDVSVNRLRLFNYGDETAAVNLRGTYNAGFNSSFEAVYRVAVPNATDVLTDKDNIFLNGINMLYAAHFANFAGTDVRILYFVLAMFVCAMIVAGNVLWLVKRQKRNPYPRTFAVVRATTLGACIGIITATALAFLLERVLPEGIQEREHLIEYIFGIAIALIVVSGFFVKDIKKFIAVNLLVSASLLMGLIAFEWLVFPSLMLSLGKVHPILWYVSAGIFCIACLLFWIACKVVKIKPINGRESHTNESLVLK